MFVTHTDKILNLSSKQKPLCTKITFPPPSNLICSANTALRKPLWALPSDPNDINIWIEKGAQLDERISIFGAPKSIPKTLESGLKENLIYQIHNDTYMAVSQVPSLGFLNEVYSRAFERKLPFKSHRLHKSQKSKYMQNRTLEKGGEFSCRLKGKTYPLVRGHKSEVMNPEIIDDRYIQIIAHCHKMSISSGYVSIGYPSLFYIWNAINSIEKELKVSLKFAFGILESEWFQNSYYGSNIGSAQILSDSKIVLLIQVRSDVHPENLLEAVKRKLKFLAGGDISNPQITIQEKCTPPPASYLKSAEKDFLSASGDDSLDKALNLYEGGGVWINDCPGLPKWNGDTTYLINQTGIVFLENPKKKPGTRNPHGFHAWVEPGFSLVKQGNFDSSSWWGADQSIEEGYVRVASF